MCILPSVIRKSSNETVFLTSTVWFIHLLSPIDMMHNHTMYCCVTVICWVRQIPEMWIQDVSEMMIYGPWEAVPGGTLNGKKICYCCFFGFGLGFFTFPLTWADCTAELWLCAGLCEVWRTVCVPGTSPRCPTLYRATWSVPVGNSPQQFPNKPGFYSYRDAFW